MIRACAILIFTLALTLSASGATAQLRDNEGKEFYVAFGPNTGGEPDVETENAMSLYITSRVATSGVVQIPTLKFERTFEVAPGAPTVLRLPDGNNNLPSVMITRAQSEQVVKGMGVKIRANDDVAVFGLNHKKYSSDVFAAFPLDALGQEYRVMSYPTSQGQGARMASQFYIVAVADNTWVTITPRATTMYTKPKDVSFPVLLDEGDVYLVQSATTDDEDLTGSLIQADKPIAVFGGHERAAIPVGAVLYDGSPASRDHLVEQLPPVSALGDSFYVVPFKHSQRPDVLRIVAAHDSTIVSIGGSDRVIVQAGEFMEVRELKNPQLIVTSKPVLVAQFLATALGRLADVDLPALGDPGMSLVPPLEQYLHRYNVALPSVTAGIYTITTVLPDDAYSATTIDGNAVGEVQYIPGSNYVYSTLSVSPGMHTIESSRPIYVTVHALSGVDSYVMPAGSGVEPGGLTKSDVFHEDAKLERPVTQVLGLDRQLRYPEDIGGSLVYDRAGRMVGSIGVDGTRNALDGLASGLYFYRTGSLTGSFLIP